LLLRTIPHVAVGQRWLTDNVVDRAWLPKVFDRLRLIVEAHSRGAKALVFDDLLLRAEHAARKDADPRPVTVPTAGTSTR